MLSKVEEAMTSLAQQLVEHIKWPWVLTMSYLTGWSCNCSSQFIPYFIEH